MIILEQCKKKLLKKRPELDVKDDDPRANELPFIFAIEDHITQVGLEEYRKNGYFGEGESGNDWKYAWLRNPVSGGNRVAVGYVDSDGLFVFADRPDGSLPNLGRAFLWKFS